MTIRHYVSIQPVGGLGNQLFAFYAGLAAARTRSLPLVVDLSRKDKGVTDHGVSIVDFDILQLQNVSEGTPLRLGHRLLFAFAEKLSRFFGPFAIFMGLGVYTSSTSDIDKKVLASTGGASVKLRGHFIHQFVLDFMVEESRLHKIGISEPGISFLSALERMALEDPVCLHIRRGDYLRPNSEQSVLGMSYYISALNDLKLNNRPIWIFTDSPLDEDVVALSRKYHAMITARSFRLSASEEFVLLMNSSTLVASNSTFSLLAVALGQAKESRLPSAWGVDFTGLRPNGVTGIRYIQPFFKAPRSGSGKHETLG